MFGPYGDESPEELRAIRTVNTIGVLAMLAFALITVGVALQANGIWLQPTRPASVSCRIPEQCAASLTGKQ